MPWSKLLQTLGFLCRTGACLRKHCGSKLCQTNSRAHIRSTFPGQLGRIGIQARATAPQLPEDTRVDTGLPRLVRHLVTPLVQVVEKTEGLPRLLDSLRSIFASRVPAVHRALIRHLETIQREYLQKLQAVTEERTA